MCIKWHKRVLSNKQWLRCGQVVVGRHLPNLIAANHEHLQISIRSLLHCRFLLVNKSKALMFFCEMKIVQWSRSGRLGNPRPRILLGLSWILQVKDPLGLSGILQASQGSFRHRGSSGIWRIFFIAKHDSFFLRFLLARATITEEVCFWNSMNKLSSFTFSLLLWQT